MNALVQKVTFTGAYGDELAARLDLPAGQIRATAVFAHCFSCSKDLAAARRIAGELARQGVAVLRFDFTGLGRSEGDFANTNFSSNCEDLVKAAEWLADAIEPPSLLVGHSLGGAAVLAVAGQLAHVKAVAAIGAPADVGHVVNAFAAKVDQIETTGQAEVSLAGRPFTIRKQFLDDIGEHKLLDVVEALRAAVLLLHAPRDDTVGIENATELFVAAKHPKSFVSLDDADHLLNDPADAEYAARVIGAWASRYLPVGADRPAPRHEGDALAMETGAGKFQTYLIAGEHRLLADEPVDVGGLDSGPAPYDFLAMALASCTSMTLRMYADYKGLELGRLSVSVSHDKVHAADCAECTDEQRESDARIDRFARSIRVDGGEPDELKAKLLEIADKCPVHRTLERGAVVATELTED